ncbi:HTH_48 domain-containing protein [Trichonephila clavipes]|nr:HTH_48 domain-containing protein [Trichonephila clavipes]
MSSSLVLLKTNCEKRLMCGKSADPLVWCGKSTRGVPAWVSSSSFDHGSKLQGPLPIALVLLYNNTITQIRDEWVSVYGDSAPSFTTVKFWADEFKRGRKSLRDDERSRRPNTATTVENIV